MVQEVLQRRQQPWRGVQWLATRSWWHQLRGSSKLILLTTTWEAAAENDHHSMVVQHLKQSGKVKKLNKGCLHELTANQKKLFWSVFFSYSMQQWHFSIRLGSAMKSVFYMTIGDDQLSGWIEKKLQSTPQSQTCTKKRLWSLIGGLLPVWSTSFWILAKPLHLRRMLSPWWEAPRTATPAASIGQQKARFSMTTPDHTLHNWGLKSWMNAATKFCLIRHIHLTSRQPTTTSSGISTTFCRENTSITSRRQKMLSKSLLNPEA